MPSPVMPLEGVTREPVGSTSVRGYLLATDAASLAESGSTLAGGGRVVRQLSESWALGGELAGGAGLGRWSQRYAVLGRVHGRFFFEEFWAVSAGVGGAFGWGNTGSQGSERLEAGFATADVGLHCAPPLSERWKWYAGGAVQATVPIRDARFYTVYLTPSVGLNYLATARLRLGADISAPLVVGYRREGKTVEVLGQRVEARQEPSWLIGTLSVAYVFGG